MSTDHLTSGSHATPLQMVDTVLAVLSGTPVATAAAKLNIPTEHVADAVEAYQAAGYRALEERATGSGWYSVRVEFPDWQNAEETAATVVGPRLGRLHDRGLLRGWWYVRKHPCWRLRLCPTGDTGREELESAVNDVLDGLALAGVITRWWSAIYEPETAAFGGPVGTEITHELFCADTDRVLQYLRQPSPALGRKEVSMLVCGTLLSAAGLDRFERGDVWSRVAELRPLPSAAFDYPVEKLADRIRPLVAAPIGTLAPTGPGTFAAPWTDAARHAGQTLATAAAAGRLDRGVRHVMTHLVIFHWNRLGLDAATQAVLSRAAREALLPAGSR